MKLAEYLEDQSWRSVLESEFKAPYFLDMEAKLSKEYSADNIFPQKNDIFSALNFTPFLDVKVVILGQDPYHGKGQAHGLSFSVKDGIKIPPSLVNIFKELESDLGVKTPTSGDLQSWAKSGVLLLNNQLTVVEGKPMSHANIGWDQFTDKIIELINEKHKNIVFILWGAPAQKKAKTVDSKKHFIIKSPHPSPLSSYRGFFGSKPFSQTNNYLISKNLAPINWNIPQKSTT